ncbi:MAG: cytochrome c biogenesis protein ResB, partial [Thiovulaceae bacterium]|nr:cytochrome c biogenesis protein ResB [Sulfurimonadaceae bacterium]
MKTFLSYVGSMKTMAVLMAIFAFSIGYATFIENDYGTITAKAEVYNAKWFELLLLLLSINLLVNIFKYKMYTRKKAPIFIFHVAFLVIVVGAAITRYFGFEGTMHIREGEESSVMQSADTFFSVEAQAGEAHAKSSEIVYLSKRGSNALGASLELEGKKIEVEMIEYIPDAIEELVEVKEGGFAIAELMITSGGNGTPLTLKEGSFYEAEGFILDFNSKLSFKKPVISVFVEEGALYMNHPMAMRYLKMDSGEQGELVPNEKEPFVGRTLFSAGGESFVVRDFKPSAKIELISDPNASPMRSGYDALRFRVNVADETKEISVMGRSGVLAKPHTLAFGDMNVSIFYGAKEIKLPFALHLKDFQLERYPGSMSPSSYASEVVLLDQEQNINMPYRIYMNHILEHRGYRFFQASYDQDEMGTILSVNNDPGTLPSYIGYFLLGLGMFWSLFSRENRFAALAKKAKDASQKHATATLAAMVLALGSLPLHATAELDPALKTILAFDSVHAKHFGELVVQDSGGRMKPLNTLSTQVVAKLYRSDTMKIGKNTLDANQVLLGMMIRPDIYRDIKMIYTKDEEINKLLGVKLDAKYVSFSQFFVDPDNMSGYKLAQYVDEAVRKEPKYRNTFDKAVLKVDEKVNIAYMVFTGDLIKIWPKPNDASNKWLGTIEALKTLQSDKANEVRNIAVVYFSAVDTALEKNDWKGAEEALGKIAEYQKFYGSEVYPSKNRIKAEVFYNEANIFERLFPYYMVVGFALLILSFVKILQPKFKIELYTKITLWLLVAFFVAHTVGLANRWYISG